MENADELLGIGFRVQHGDDLIENKPAIGWLELHSENYMVEGGPRRWILGKLAERYPLSLHGVGLSLGSVERPNAAHLRELKALVDDVKPLMISEHLAWSKVNGYFLADLLPLPLTFEAIEVASRNIEIMQQMLGRRILVENIAAYGELQPPEMHEAEFLNRIVDRTGCSVVLDISNLVVNERNLRRPAVQFLQELDVGAPAEIHLGGHDESEDGWLLDRHASAISDTSWILLELALNRFGPMPSLVEWDQEIPAFDVLIAEADRLREQLHLACLDFSNLKTTNKRLKGSQTDQVLNVA